MKPDDHDALRLSLGSYLTGGLSPDERQETQAHLASCPTCQAEVAQLAPLPGLIARIPPTHLIDGPSRAPAELGKHLLGELQRRQQHRRQVVRRWKILTLSSAATAVAVLVAVIFFSGRQAAPGPGRPLRAADPQIVSRGTATFEPRPWGTQIQLHLERLPPGTSFVAWVDGPGTHTNAGSWGPTASHEATVAIAANITPPHITQLVISTTAGQPLLVASP